MSDSILLEFKSWYEEHITRLSVTGISGRGKQTCIFPFMDIEKYCSKISGQESGQDSLQAK
jgi:hypothetical protein